MSTPGAEPGFLGKTLTLARKDLRVELRGRDTLPPMLVFAVSVSLLLAFTLPVELSATIRLPTGPFSVSVVLSGFLWITVLFAGLIGFGRTFEVEREEGALDSLLLVPLDRSGLYAAKALSNLVFLLSVEALVLPLFALLFDLDLGARWGTMILVVLLVDVGFAAIGTLFASVAAQTRSRELILPILALPTLVPVFIAAVELTADIFLGTGLTQVAERGWFVILIAFDVIFAIVGALAFEYTVD